MSVLVLSAPSVLDVADKLISAFPFLSLNGPLPSDDVPDESLRPEVALQRANERYPIHSVVLPLATTIRKAFYNSCPDASDF